MMDLVTLIAGQVRSKQDLFRYEGRIMDSLVNSGYRLHEADAALTLMQSLAQPDDDASADDRPDLPAGMRAMSSQERNRFTIEAFGFLGKLTALGIISADHREDIIEKAVTLHRGRIELAEVRSLIALDLFDTDGDPDELPPTSQEPAGALWN